VKRFALVLGMSALGDAAKKAEAERELERERQTAPVISEREQRKRERVIRLAAKQREALLERQLAELKKKAGR
jgi:hypothetical protein